MPERPLENLSFRNIAMRIGGFEPVERQHKPRGVAGMPRAPREIDYSNAPAAMIFANIHGLNLRDVRLNWDVADKSLDRHAIYAARVEDLFLAGFAGSSTGSKLATIGLDTVRHAFITESSTGALTFIGLHNTPEGEVALAGNNLGEKVRARAPDATYVHLPR